MKVKIICLCLLLSPGVIIHANAQTAQWNANGSKAYYNNGYVGIGTTDPQTTLHIMGASTVEAMLENTTDGYTSLSFLSNNKRWQWSKRPSDEFDALKLFYNNGTTWLPPYLSLQTNGNVGVGVDVPAYKLHIGGKIYSTDGIIVDQQTGGGISGWFRGYASGNANVVIQGGAGNYTAFWLTADPNTLRIGANGNTEPSLGVINVSNMGQVGVGTTSYNDLTYKLYVETGIRTRKIKVDQNGWPDYVFDKAYALRPLSEVESFIKKYQHLPDVPSAAEVKKEGIDLGENQAVLLKKVEELTLYLIEQKKEIDLLKEENKKMNDMQKRLNVLEELLKKQD